MKEALTLRGQPVGPHCLNPSACPAHPKSAHCRPCETRARWAAPGYRERVSEKLKAAAAVRVTPPFRDELKARRAALYASAFGVRKAGELLGISPSKVALWRRRLERIEGKTYERVATHHFQRKLTLDQAREIRALIKAGEKFEYIAALYGVHRSTVRRIKNGVRYPILAAEEDRAAWDRLGSAA